jgi:hypothetical protein
MRLEGSSMIVFKCDLCGQIEECLQKEIEHKEYDICRKCWSALEEKLEGKGRAKESKEIILLPPPEETEEQEDNPTPGEPPTIWGASERAN